MRDGSTVQHQGQTTHANGKVSTRESTVTKNGNVVTRDAKRVGPNDGTTEIHGTRTR